jgi:hypothetical protein
MIEKSTNYWVKSKLTSEIVFKGNKKDAKSYIRKHGNKGDYTYEFHA